MSISLQVTGTTQLRQRLLRYAQESPKAAASALFAEGEAIMADSKEHYVPIDLSVLKNSGHVQPPVTKGDDISVTMGFGGAAKDYAIVQHERLDFHHRVGGPKYLERPLLKAASGLLERIAKRIRQGFQAPSAAETARSKFEGLFGGGES